MADKVEKTEKRERKPKAEAQEAPQAGRPKASNRNSARLRGKFTKEVMPALMKEFGIENPMAVPKIEKVVVNMGVGEATQNAKVLDPAVNDLQAITGQKPVVTKARK